MGQVFLWSRMMIVLFGLLNPQIASCISTSLYACQRLHSLYRLRQNRVMFLFRYKRRHKASLCPEQLDIIDENLFERIARLYVLAVRRQEICVQIAREYFMRAFKLVRGFDRTTKVQDKNNSEKMELGGYGVEYSAFPTYKPTDWIG